MFRRPRPDEIQEERPTFTKGERIGSAIAHAASLVVGMPLFILFSLTGGLSVGITLIPCPIVAYLISRSFRRRQSAWGAFQGMQAAIVQLILLALVFAAAFLESSTAGSAAFAQIQLVLFVSAFLLFLYTLWGGWDCAWGYDFRYIFISNFVDRVTAANLRRQERRQQPRPPSPPDRIDR